MKRTFIFFARPFAHFALVPLFLMKCLCGPFLSNRSEIRRLRDSTTACRGVCLNVRTAMYSIRHSRNFVAGSSFNPYQM